MAYDIYIGNAVPTTIEEDDGSYYSVWGGVTVNRVELEDAPSFPNDHMTGKGNSRHPGYGQWADFCSAVGLTDLFFNKAHGLMRVHPGTFKLEFEHLVTVRDALYEYREAHPDAVPGWHDVDRVENGNLARLLWLEFWIDWALKNCERPAIHNH